MPANMMNAPVGSLKLNVSGRSSAMVTAGPMPGSTPTNVPSVTPSAASARFAGESASAKPPARSPRTASVATMSEPRDPDGQRHREHAREQQVDGDREDDARDHVADERAAAERPRRDWE